MTEPTALYRLYDTDDRLLYIGITKNLEQRWTGHKYSPTSSAWWPAVHRKVIEWHPTREAADEAETAAIVSEVPLHNKDKTPSSWNVKRTKRSAELDWTIALEEPYSQQAARILAAELEAGSVQPGEPVPTIKDLHQRFGLSAATCGVILQTLAARGLVHQRGKGVATTGLVLAPSCSYQLSSDPGSRLHRRRRPWFALWLWMASRSRWWRAGPGRTGALDPYSAPTCRSALTPRTPPFENPT